MSPSLMIAFTHLFTGDTIRTIIECDEILSVEARPNPAAFLLRGWALVRRGEFNNAERDLSRGIEAAKVSEGLAEALLGFAYRLRAICYEETAEWNLCLSDLKKALALYEADADADAVAELRDQHSRVERKQAGDFSAGESSDSDVRPESARPLRKQILDALVAGDLERALKLCESRIDDINVRFLRGLAKDFRGRRLWAKDDPAAEKDFDEAIADYADVIEEATSHFLSKAYVRRSQLQIALEQPKAALAGLDELAARRLLNAGDKSLHIYAGLSRGLAKLMLYEFNDAGAAFDKVLELDPKNLRALDGNGQIDLYTENRAAALAYFKSALENSAEKSDVAHFTFMVALTYYLDDKYEQAIAVLQPIEPMLGELQERERRLLHQKIKVFREFLSAGASEPEEEVEEEVEEEPEEKVRCRTLLLNICDLVTPPYQYAA